MKIKSSAILAVFLWLGLSFWSGAAVASGDSGTKPLIVLVPGFFNSLSPKPDFAPYFSNSIVKTIQAHHLDVASVPGLLSVGGVVANGDRVETYLTALAAANPGRRMVILAHSAGGLYMLHALTKHPELPVDTVITLGTPYGGVDFVDNLAAHVPGLDSLVKWMDLESLREFETKRMSMLLDHYRVPDNVRWVTLAGYQDSCFLASCAFSAHLSWILSIAQHLMSHRSDGVVTVSSALAEGVNLSHFDGTPVKFEHWDDFQVPLEHWEIVQESDLFRLLGVVDTDRIRAAQDQIFGGILVRLGL